MGGDLGAAPTPDLVTFATDVPAGEPDESFLAAQCWPAYEGPAVAGAIELLRAVPHAPAAPQPGQADLDAIIATSLSPA